MPRALARLLAIVEGRSCAAFICAEMDLAEDPTEPLLATEIALGDSMPSKTGNFSFAT